MDMNVLKQQVEQIIGTPLTVRELDWSAWNELIATSDRSPASSSMIRAKDDYMWLWKTELSTVQVVKVPASQLTEREVKLIDLILSTVSGNIKAVAPSKKEDELRSIELGTWIQERIESHELNIEIPDGIALKSRLQGTMLPLLLSGTASGQEIQFSKLNKLLRSYFGGETVLVPLRKDWLILVNERLLRDLREENEEDDTIAERDMLGDLCQGLYELITNEWGGGGFHLAASDPFEDARRIVAVAYSLRETVLLGRAFYVTEHIFFSWNLQLERLVYSIPENQRLHFIDAMMVNHTNLLKDEEMQSTLHTFFQLDCNVSETAKRLYIHRNTLIYRIDKFKQETGLDVRSFQDAVLVKLGLLLYKVTKSE